MEDRPGQWEARKTHSDTSYCLLTTACHEHPQNVSIDSNVAMTMARDTHDIAHAGRDSRR